MSQEARDYVHVKLVPARNGRRAVLARLGMDSPWVQVESILGEMEAADFAGDLAVDDGERATYIRQAEGEDWGDDAPV